MVDVPPGLRFPGYCRGLGRFWLNSGRSLVRQSHANWNCWLAEWTVVVVVRVVDGGGGLHGDGDGDGGGGLHGNCCQVRRPHVASSNLALVVCGCHRVYCSLGASRRCRGDLVRSTNTPKTPGVMWRCSRWSRSSPGVMWTIPGAMWRWQCLECLSELIL